MTQADDNSLIYACIDVAPGRELQVGPVPSMEAAAVVEEVMRERMAELIAAEDMIREVNGRIVGIYRWDVLHSDVLREGLTRLARRTTGQER